jgi:hypothetical protein
MKTLIISLALTLLNLTVSAQEPQHTDSIMALADLALEPLGLTHEDVRFDQDEMATWGGDRFVTRYFRMLHRNPFKLPKYSQLNLELMSANVTNLPALLADAGKKIDHPIRRGLIGDQLSKYTEIPDSLPRPSMMRGQGSLTESRYKSLRNGIDLLFAVVDDDEHLFRQGLGDANKDKYRERLWEFFMSEAEGSDEQINEIIEKIDFDYLIAGAEDLTEAVKRIADSTSTFSFPTRVIEIKTRKGLVVVGTTGDDKYEFLEPPLLIIDGGGNDRYRFSGYNSDFPFSAIVDLAGNDRYESTDSTLPGIGGAVLGMSVVIDLAGDDSYIANRVAQGSGLFGVGLLLDKAGDDIYSGNMFVQGAGIFGIGLLADSTGNDSSYCVIESQGFGYTRGCGVLVNYEGDDVYIGENDTLLNASSQSGTDNNSLAQGCGFGRRADYLDGHSWAGGVGILCDANGNDRYSAGLFAQGCAYWFSVGMLIDGGGADSYDGIWYVQGSGAHFGVGLLDDFAGDDRYNPNSAPKNMAVGAGHDFTIGFLNERGGNDQYNVPNLSLGGGNSNGIGIFVDHAGDDLYQTKQGTTLGRAHGSLAGSRAYLRTIGLFIDMMGTDQYSTDWARDNSRWQAPYTDPAKPDLSEIGVGIDAQP